MNSWPAGEGWEVVDGFHRHRVGKENKAIAVRSARLLLAGTEKYSIGTLWTAATGGGRKQDCQLDVVFALWKNGLLADSGQ